MKFQIFLINKTALFIAFEKENQDIIGLLLSHSKINEIQS